MLDTPCSEVVWRVLAAHCIDSVPFTSLPLRHRVLSNFNWSLLYVGNSSHSHAVYVNSACQNGSTFCRSILLAAASETSNRNTSCPLSPSVPAVGCYQPSVLKILETVPKKMHKILSECRYVRIQSGSRYDCVTGRLAEMAEFIYLLTAVGLTPGGSSTVQCTFTHKQCIEQHN